ncbi:MAG TPA: ACT domain-containing protein [Acetobacteraceae bacterium]|jgi:glycine cleavage system regulatory protein|nr:ACT domain-containing protein [Acetobacteraceae bacterium]
MPTALVLSVLGPDRPGLVAELSTLVAAHGGNWLESRMVQLAGQFAGAVLVMVPEAQVAALTASLQALGGAGLRVVASPAAPAGGREAGRMLRLAIVGQDRPGILRDVTAVLARQGATIDELSTEIASGSFSGETLFRATCRVRAPASLSDAALREALEHLAPELMVDVEPNGSAPRVDAAPDAV